MEPYQSPAKVKVVALLDTILTVVIMAQIIAFAVYPLWVDYSESAVAAKDALKAAKEAGRRVTRQIIALPPTKQITASVGRSRHPMYDYPNGVIDDGWLWTFTVLVTMLGLSSTFSVLALLRSASSKIDPEDARKMTNVWMYFDICTIFLAAVEFIFVLATPVFGIQLMPPIPTLLFVGFRAVFFCVVLQEMNLMAPTVIPTLDMAMIEAKQLRAQQRQERIEQGLKVSPIRQSQPVPIPIVPCTCLTPTSSF